jgi:hypothetical protein
LGYNPVPKRELGDEIKKVVMSRWNKERRLLDHEHSHFLDHRLVEVEEPNLMRNIFPYTEVARIDFDYKFVMPSPPEQMLLTDTTFRDGQQARPPYTVRQIVDIFDLLHKPLGAQRDHPADRVFPLQRQGQRGRGTLPGAGLSGIPRSPAGSGPTPRTWPW